MISTKLRGLLGATALALLPCTASLAQTTVVSPGSMNGWSVENTYTSSTAFVNGPSAPPAGTGSFQMATGAGVGSGQGGKAYIATNAFNGTKLNDLGASNTTFTYGTYISQSPTSPTTAPVINLQIDLDGNGSRDTTFVFEPVYSVGTQGSVQSGTWQNWDAAHGNWRYTGAPAALAGAAQYQPLSYYTSLAGMSNAQVVDWYSFLAPEGSGFAFSVGSSDGQPWHDFSGNVDNLKLGLNGGPVKTYNFEATAAVPEPASVATFALTGIGVLGLVLRARRTRSSAL